MSENKDKISEALEELTKLSEEFQIYQKEQKSKDEEYWNSLTKEQQLSVFCSVVRRIHEGEIEKRGTYRYVLYNVFNFGPESYVPAQLSGYLDIHNSIFIGSDLHSSLVDFAIKMCNVSEKDAVKKADKYIIDTQF